MHPPVLRSTFLWLTAWLGLGWSLSPIRAVAAPAVGPLTVSTANPRYLARPDGTPILLAGAHDGWELQDFAWGDTAREKPFAWNAFLDEMAGYGHNLLRLWVVEHTRLVEQDADLTQPMPYERVGAGAPARDGQGKFDLDKFNPVYFQRLRDRVAEAGQRGFYVVVMLFQGWSIEDKGGRVNPWPYHPFHAANNVHGIDGDLDGDGQGRELHIWLGEDHAITKLQRVYVRHVLETLQDLDHVLYEISNESHPESLEWQRHMVAFIKSELDAASAPRPVGISVPFGTPRKPGLNEALLASPADWVAPNREAPGGFNYRDNPPVAEGRKVILSDSDHLHGNRLQDPRWVWKTFCRGHNLLFMDRWTEAHDDPGRVRVRKALGEVLRYSRRLDLKEVHPTTGRSSTRFCLAHREGAQLLVYQPDSGGFTVDLSGFKRSYAVEWYQPSSGRVMKGERLEGGGSVELGAPFAGEAVLFLEVESEP